MQTIRSYWLGKDDVPFKTLLTVAQEFLSAESYGDDPGCLEHLAQTVNTLSDRERFITFKAELRQVALGQTNGLRERALWTAAEWFFDEYDIKTTDDIGFARTLWHKLYPDEPLPDHGHDG